MRLPKDTSMHDSTNNSTASPRRSTRLSQKEAISYDSYFQFKRITKCSCLCISTTDCTVSRRTRTKNSTLFKAMNTVVEESESSPEVPKRGRGRPRKVKNVTELPKKVSEAPKRASKIALPKSKGLAEKTNGVLVLKPQNLPKTSTKLRKKNGILTTTEVSSADFSILIPDVPPVEEVPLVPRKVLTKKEEKNNKKRDMMFSTEDDDFFSSHPIEPNKESEDNVGQLFEAVTMLKQQKKRISKSTVHSAIVNASMRQDRCDSVDLERSANIIMELKDGLFSPSPSSRSSPFAVPLSTKRIGKRRSAPLFLPTPLSDTDSVTSLVSDCSHADTTDLYVKRLTKKRLTASLATSNTSACFLNSTVNRQNFNVSEIDETLRKNRLMFHSPTEEDEDEED